MKLLNQYAIGYKDVFFLVLCVVFIIEQIFYRMLGSYPYKYGLVIKSIEIKKTINNNTFDFDAGMISELRINKTIDKDIYFYKKHTIAQLAPLLFCGRIQFNKFGLLTIRIGPITALFVIYLMVYPVLSATYYHILDSVLIFVFVVFVYSRFVNLCNKTFRDR